MAHLVRCWCGKIYRCDIEHPPRIGVCTIVEPIHERNCPDQVIHGNRQIGLFTTIKSEKFETLHSISSPAERTGIVLEANSMKQGGAYFVSEPKFVGTIPKRDDKEIKR